MGNNFSLRRKTMASSTIPDTREVADTMRQEGGEQAEDFAEFVSEVGDSLQKYCKRRPGVVAGVLFGLGFFCGWKLRPW
jgi:hypothetical protein